MADPAVYTRFQEAVALHREPLIPNRELIERTVAERYGTSRALRPNITVEIDIRPYDAKMQLVDFMLAALRTQETCYATDQLQVKNEIVTGGVIFTISSRNSALNKYVADNLQAIRNNWIRKVKRTVWDWIIEDDLV